MLCCSMLCCPSHALVLCSFCFIRHCRMFCCCMLRYPMLYCSELICFMLRC
jgi:hypothetical protein